MKKTLFIILGILCCFTICAQTIEELHDIQEVKVTEGFPYSTFLCIDKLARKDPEIKIYYDVKVRGPSLENPLKIMEFDPTEYMTEIREIVGLAKLGIKEVIDKKYANYIIIVVYNENLYDQKSVNMIISGKAKKIINYQLIDSRTTEILCHNSYTKIELRYKDRQEGKLYRKTIVSEWDEKKPPIIINSKMNIEYNKTPVMVYSDKFLLNDTAKDFLPFIIEVYKKNGYYYSNLVTGEKSMSIPKSSGAFFIYAHSDYLGKLDCNLLAIELYAFVKDSEPVIVWNCYATVPKKYYILNPLYYWEKMALFYPNEMNDTIVYW